MEQTDFSDRFTPLQQEIKACAGLLLEISGKATLMEQDRILVLNRLKDLFHFALAYQDIHHPLADFKKYLETATISYYDQYRSFHLISITEALSFFEKPEWNEMICEKLEPSHSLLLSLINHFHREAQPGKQLAVRLARLQNY